jgi:hypothetical protein
LLIIETASLIAVVLVFVVVSNDFRNETKSTIDCAPLIKSIDWEFRDKGASFATTETPVALTSVWNFFTPAEL